MNLILNTTLSILLFSQASWAQCDGVFRESGVRSFSGVTAKTASACVPSGTYTVILNKPSNRPALSSSTLREILGNNGRDMHGDFNVSNSPSVNCHAFSAQLSGVPRFPENAWIDAKDFVVIIKEYFGATLKSYSSGSLRNLNQDPAIRDEDLVLMLDSRKVLQHSGVISRVRAGANVENWVLSKLDEGPTVLVPLENLARYYPIDTVLVRRPK